MNVTHASSEHCSLIASWDQSHLADTTCNAFVWHDAPMQNYNCTLLFQDNCCTQRLFLTCIIVEAKHVSKPAMVACSRLCVKASAALSVLLMVLGLVLLFEFHPTEEATKRSHAGVCERLEGKNQSEATCEHFGGCHGYCPENACQCTSQCNNIGNCCADFVETCMNKSDVHYKLEKWEEKMEELEHGAGIVGREWILSLVMVFFVVTMMAILYFAHSSNQKMQDAVYELCLGCIGTSVFQLARTRSCLQQREWSAKDVHNGFHLCDQHLQRRNAWFAD